MNKFVCSECGTRYTSRESTPPPGVKWDDGHVCKVIPCSENIEGSFKEIKDFKDFIEEEYPNALEAVKDFLLEALTKYKNKISKK